MVTRMTFASAACKGTQTNTPEAKSVYSLSSDSKVAWLTVVAITVRVRGPEEFSGGSVCASLWGSGGVKLPRTRDDM